MPILPNLLFQVKDSVVAGCPFLSLFGFPPNLTGLLRFPPLEQARWKRIYIICLCCGIFSMSPAPSFVKVSQAALSITTVTSHTPPVS